MMQKKQVLCFSLHQPGSKSGHKEKQILTLSDETAHMQEMHPHPQGLSEITGTYDPQRPWKHHHWSSDVSASKVLEHDDIADPHRCFFLPLYFCSLLWNASHRSCSGSAQLVIAMVVSCPHISVMEVALESGPHADLIREHEEVIKRQHPALCRCILCVHKYQSLKIEFKNNWIKSKKN